MPDLVALRLHPAEPVAPSVFTTMLTGLSITAFDLSFDDSKDGAQLGKAENLADPHLPSSTNNQVNVNAASIMQHYVDVVVDPVGPKQRRLESVATAVVVVTPPSGGEYPTPQSYDLRLEIERDGQALGHQELEYNVGVVTVAGSLSTSQKTYFQMPTSAFVALPPSGVGQDPSLATVDLPSDGQPPVFDDLCAAIDKVLAKDPGGANADLEHRSPLTAAQSRHVASEIVWNRIGKPPPALPELGDDAFGAMYTKPPVDPTLANKDGAEMARLKFEGELRGYHGTNDAATLRLAGFVFSASAAIAAEQLSREATRARLDFPVLTSASASTTISHASAGLLNVGTATSPFVVPAAYFYALTANMPSQVGPEQRYDLGRFAPEQHLLTEFQVAVDGGVIDLPVAPFAGVGPALSAAQAARRLHALGSAVSSATEIEPNASVKTVVDDWLAHGGPTGTIDEDFWKPESTTQPAAYLDLLLRVITDDHEVLIAALKAPPVNVATVDELVAITDEGWRDLFLGPMPHTGPFQLALLPPFTQPGTPGERTEAFIRHLRKFFKVKADPPGTTIPGANAPPPLGTSVNDVLAAFEARYDALAASPLEFGTPLDLGAAQAAASDVLPGDAAAQAWLVQAIQTIAALYELTDVTGDELRFSLMEALYARGFTSAASVCALLAEQFAFALTGSVAYPFASVIHQKAGAGPVAVGQPGPFAPVNPDGMLTDCVPPRHRSPLGPVAYLHELLRVSAASTCADPLPAEDCEPLANLLAGRRGPLGDLHVTRANLEIALPVVDLVDESLESLSAGLQACSTGGAVYDTTGDERLRAAVPEHSSPATPVDKPDAYELLRSDFTAPGLRTRRDSTSTAPTSRSWAPAGSRRCGAFARRSRSSPSTRPTSPPTSSGTCGAIRSGSRRRSSTCTSRPRSTTSSTRTTSQMCPRRGGCSCASCTALRRRRWRAGRGRPSWSSYPSSCAARALPTASSSSCGAPGSSRSGRPGARARSERGSRTASRAAWTTSRSPSRSRPTRWSRCASWRCSSASGDGCRRLASRN
jgi:hypothetical protein